MTAKYKVIFIDWSQTLSHSKFWGHLENKSPLFPIIDKALFKDNHDLLDPWMRGEYTAEQIVKLLAKKTKIYYQYLFSELVKSCKQMHLVSPKILDLVKKIRKTGIKVVIATDNMDTFSRWTVPALKLQTHFDTILNSHELRVQKSDSFFNIFFRKWKIDPRESILIDDSSKNITSAQRLGIKCFQISADLSIVSALRKVVYT